MDNLMEIFFIILLVRSGNTFKRYLRRKYDLLYFISSIFRFQEIEQLLLIAFDIHEYMTNITSVTLKNEILTKI